MVVAEVPLWVVHSNSSTTASKSREGGAQANGTGGSSQSSVERASKSLLLLDSSAAGGGQKAPIYSVAVHGSRFATGGGDGTVRIWNAGSLFPKPKSLIKSRYHKPTFPGDADPNNQTLVSAATNSANNNYESSGESSQDSGRSHEGTPPSSPESVTQPQAAGPKDLSSVVRKKGEPSSPTRKLPPQPEAGAKEGETVAAKKLTQKDRLLCTLSAHTGSSVLAVRFSNNGKYLASAGDDAVVCIYAKQSSGPTGAMVARGNLEATSCTLEHWIRIKVCRGHGLDVVGLAWAPDDSHLVSCSLDSKTPVIVWKLTDLAEDDNNTNHHHYNNVLTNPYKILGKGIHTSTVKGVTFDPAGTYLASSADDPSVCIWRAHDDWGLEKRIDAKSGIFRKWNVGGSGSGNGAGPANLSSQSLFRRLSWSTDGAYICATNAVVKNKNVASTISREGWAVSSSKSTATGAVNLVGHKQPVVAACHCPYLLNARKAASHGEEAEEEEDEDVEPEYSTLLALGDKRGFVTVWSTGKARPIFKIQCSETRCTVTDLSWGRLPVEGDDANTNSTEPNLGDLMLLVSLLDGQVVALRFGIPDELGKLLSSREQNRVFQLRYGIDLNDSATMGRRLFVGDNSGRPKLIENALQFSLEHLNQSNHDSEEDEAAEAENRRLEREAAQARQKESMMSSEDIRKNQLESRSKGGKKRIQPLLMMQTAPLPAAKKPKVSNGENGKQKIPDTLEAALEFAEKAASGAAAVKAAHNLSYQKSTTIVAANNTQVVSPTENQQRQQQIQAQQRLLQQQQAQSSHHHPPANIQLLAGTQSTPQIPHSTDRIHSVDLPLAKTTIFGGEDVEGNFRYVADCTNSIRVPQGSAGSALPCTVLSISKAGQTLWNDHLLGSTCCAIAASKSWLVVGTTDGSLQIYGTSPTLGWKSASAFRSHPPFVLGRPIVSLHLKQHENSTELVVVTSDGRFSVYTLELHMKLKYKGSLLPAMTHMLLSADLETDIYLPKLARIQLTETSRLLLLLSLQSASSAQGRDFSTPTDRGGGKSSSVGAGGSLQGFIYDLDSELWMRMADSRFVLSDFYNTLPTLSKKTSTKGELSKLDDSVRMGATASTLQRSRKSRSMLVNNGSSYQTTTTTTISNGNENGNDVASRSHCEDRMACALALGSASEFEYWFSMYIKILSLTGSESLLRLIIDMLLGKCDKNGEGKETQKTSTITTATCWWLSDSPKVLKFDRVKLVRAVVIPEMSKNRALQRITNEVAIEVEGL